MIVQQAKDGGRERTVLTACVVSRSVLARISPRWDGRLFSSDWGNLIAGWCVDHFRKHSTAPGKEVIYAFQDWSQKTKDEATVRTVESFLGHLSDHYSRLKKEVNATLVLEQADKLFNRVRAQRLAESIEADLDDGNDDKAVKRITEFSKVKMSSRAGIDLFQDLEAWRKAFEDDIDAEPVVKYPGALGKFFGKSHRRGNFLSYIGKNKVGKSWALVDVAWRAVEQRKRVAFFAVGDMTEGQMIERFAGRLLNRPTDAKTYHWPKSIEPGAGPEGDPAVERVEKETTDRLTFGDCAKKLQWYQKRILRSKESYFKLACYENYSVNVLEVRSAIDEWIEEGFTPDLVVIDYSDLLAPVDGKVDTREQINTTWKYLRSISQKYHVLLVTATQADAQSFKSGLLSRVNFSEDRRKLDHVTGMIGINQRPEEEENEVVRLNWVNRREEKAPERKVVYVAGSRDCCNPCVVSCF
jgi:hypothetical protein